MTRNEQVYTMAQDWVRWLDTRRFFGEPAQRSFLVQMVKDQPKSNGEPTIPLNPEIAAFNMAVSSLPMGLFVPFVAVYCDYRPKPVKPVKAMASDIGVSSVQFYERAHKAAGSVASTTQKLVLLNRQMRAEVSGITPGSGS